MTFEIDYFDHDADIGIIGRGKDLETAFINAALATFKIMSDISIIPAIFTVKIQFQESDKELALVTWLNSLLAKARENKLIFSKFILKHTDDTWYGEAFGDHWHENYTRGTEVKGATLTMLSVSKKELWEARCVVDV